MQLEGPKFDQIRRNNRSAMKQEEYEEKLHDDLEAMGVVCEECRDKYHLPEMFEETDEDGDKILLCKYCV